MYIHVKIGPDDPHTKRVQQLFKQHLKVEEDENEDDGIMYVYM